MSHIPSSAMPRARSKDGQEKEGGRRSVKKQAGKLAEKARDNPKTAIAAGAVLAGAVAAAAALPLVRRSRSKSEKDSGSGETKSKKS